VTAAVDTKIFATREEVAAAVATRVAETLTAKPNSVLGLPAGQTPVPVYAELRRLCGAGMVDFSRATCFLLDEFVGLDRSSPCSFYQFVSEHLFAGINADPGRVHALNGAATDLVLECGRYEAAIESSGGIDLQVLGLGRNGHIGFNEPADGLEARTHRVTLRPETRRDNAARFGGHDDQVPSEALSMGIGTILNATAIVMIATGEAKANPVERMVRGLVTTQMPASFLQLHPNVELYLDRAAAGRL
jgi:glucosamine-6-phosphate deaminase